MELLRQPFEPKPTPEYLFGRYADHVDEWSDYLEGW
jgi:hypothetical protein